MTGRVFDCSQQPLRLRSGQNKPSGHPRSTRGFTAVLLVALVLVPIAGAAAPPQGLAIAALSALSVLGALRLLGTRVPWGALGLLIGSVGVLVLRAQLAPLGPGFFVATCLCLIVWLVNHTPGSARDGGRPQPGSRERDAQLVMGFSGERHVGRVLAAELSSEFVLVNGLKLPRGAGDIDHLIIGPTGVFVLETKTMAGKIQCAPDGTWQRTKVGRGGTRYDGYIGDPAAQVHRNVMAVRDCLRRRVPGLFRGRPLWIEGMVVFPHPRAELATEHSPVPAVRLDDAVPLICMHAPARPLQADEIEAAAEALLIEGQAQHVAAGAQSAQAIVEVALVLPLVLGLLFGTLALSRIVQAQTAVVAVAHEAARAGALAASPETAVDRMRRRVDLVAPGFGLDPRALTLEWDVSTFGQDRGHVRATVRYTVDLGDLPLGGWVPATAVRAEHVEWLDPFRSGFVSVTGAAP